MRAVEITETGGPDVLIVKDVAEPAAAPGQLLVETAAIGVNYLEIHQRQGSAAVALPFRPGGEASGTVIGVGDSVDDALLGQRIMTCQGVGTYAERFVVDSAKAVVVPDGIDDEKAAGIPLQGFTAHYLAHSVFRPEPGLTALVHAGAGGVGLLLTQLLVTAGVRVLTTVSSDEKAELSRAAGADIAFGYGDFAAAVREATDGRGVDVVFDGVGRDTFDGSLAALAVRGTLALIGAASGAVPPVDPSRLASGGSLVLTRPTIGHFIRNPEELAWRAGELIGAIENGSLDVTMGGHYALADAGAAHAALASRATTGKLLLLP